MARDIMDCETVKECLLWADIQWPGFWKFATHQPMTSKERKSLSESMNDTDPLFSKMLRQLKFCAKLDQSEEARTLLILGAKAMIAFQQQEEKQSKPDIQKYTK